MRFPCMGFAMVKEVVSNVALSILKNTKVSLAVLITLAVFLTPALTSIFAFVQETKAAIHKMHALDTSLRNDIKSLHEKINLLMIEQGIQKYKVDAIERRHLNNQQRSK